MAMGEGGRVGKDVVFNFRGDGWEKVGVGASVTGNAWPGR